MFSTFAKAYRDEIKIPIQKFLLYILLLFIFIVVSEILAILLFPDILKDLLTLFIFISLPVYILFIFITYPVISWKRRGNQIDRDMHLFITRMGVLAAAETARKEIFDVLARMREYRAIAEEVKKIYILVVQWNVPLEKACQFVADTTPSELFADFLRRLAHAVESGEAAEVFFRKEQGVVMNEYSIKYESAMRTVEILKDAFISLVVVSLFTIVVVAIIPLFTGEDAVLLMSIAILMFLFIEGGFLYLIYSIVPGEEIWHDMKIKGDAYKKINRKLAGAIVISVITLMAVVFINWRTIIPYPVPLPIFIALFITPLIYPGIFVNIEEAKILRRDTFYPAFIRSVGAALEARARDIAISLRRLSTYDFGPLTKNIEDLYKRLSIRIKRHDAWEYFNAETNSELISKFNEMYVEGIRTGGNSKLISEIISENFIKILGLRKIKYESAQSMNGILYGLCIALSLVLFMTFYMIRAFNTMFASIELPPAFSTIIFLQQKTFDFFILSLLILGLVVIHAFISASLTRIISGGHITGSLTHFVLLVWTGAITSVVITEGMKFLM